MRIRQEIEKVARSTAVMILAVILVGFTATYWAWSSSVNSRDIANQDAITQNAESLEKFLDERLISYQAILKGGAGLIDANSENVSRQQWKLFADAYRLDQQLPAIESLGYVENFSATELKKHQKTIRSQGLPKYKVTPATPTSEYSVAVYIEPQTANSPIGYNMLSDPQRAEALNQSAQTGEVATSQVLSLKNKPNKGFLMVYPIYKHPERSLELRKQQLVGFVYLAINIDELIGLANKRIPANNPMYALSEGDDPTNRNYIYKTSNFLSENEKTIGLPISLIDKKWTIHSQIDTQNLAYKQTNLRPMIVLTIGILTTLIIAFFLTQTIRSRAREVEYEKQLELQKSKDGLLSLASHQLRTPATGVKQYLGMVLQGYSGKVDGKQRYLLQRAYDSNERQLEIVNQILHVSRIESGNLKLNMEAVSLASITREFVKDHRKIIKARGQSIKVITEKALPKMNADPIYLSMVVENLISNASKYTFDKGKISINIYTSGTDMVLEVSDTGVGIDQKEINQLFRKFSRIHNELSISSGGTGIGLYLSKLIVELHGGNIEPLSRKGIGTTFRVTLPI